MGVAIDQIASNADIVFLEAAPYKAEHWQACLRDLQKRPPLPSFADMVNAAERFMVLETILRVDRYGLGILDEIGAGPKLPVGKEPDQQVQQFLKTIDWDPALRSANRWFDRLVKHMQEKDPGVRKKQWEQIHDDLRELRAKSRDALEKIIEGKEEKVKAAEKLGGHLISSMVPAIGKVQEARDRIEQVQNNLHIAFALAAYKADNGSYPKKLDSLAPKYLAKVPLDLFTGKELVYRPAQDGYLLYSFGPNGIDDEGRWYDDDPPGDDPRVRLPLPPLKKE